MKKNTINNRQNTGTKPYVPPSIFVQEIDPWALLAGSYGEIDGPGMTGGGNGGESGGELIPPPDDDEVVPTKSKYFYRPYNGIFED